MKPIKRIVLIVVAAYAFCLVSFFFMKYGIRRYQTDRYKNLNELLVERTGYDVLFIGSSRTHLTINPRIIDSVCHTNSYNAGIEGGNLYEFNMMLSAYLENHPAPEWLVLTLDLHSFVSDVELFNPTQYYPYTKNKVIRSYLNENGHSTKLLQIFPFLELTEYDDNTKGFFIKGLLNLSEVPKGDFVYKGYLSNTLSQITNNPVGNDAKDVEISESRKKCLNEMLRICKEKGIHVVITYAPEYNDGLKKRIRNSDAVFAYINSISSAANIPFFRDDRLPLCSDPSLFVNAGHLNRTGADIYSGILAEKLKGYIK